MKLSLDIIHRILKLEVEAFAHMDTVQVKLCQEALRGDWVALRECLRVLAETDNNRQGANHDLPI